MEKNNVQKCVRKLDGCKTYSYDAENCASCLDEWYLYNGYCYPGSVSNCLLYDDKNLINKCVKCKNTFYLTKDNTCETQPTINNCDTYLQEQGYCQKCQKNNFLFLSPKKCIKTVTISKCKEFKSKESCKVCEDNYYPVNYGQRCLPIPDGKSCLIWGALTSDASHDEDNCLLCKPGYLLINKMCKKWFNSINKYCIEENDEVDGKRNNVKCKYCDIDNFISINKDVATTHGVCVETDLLNYYTSSTIISNCMQLSWDNTNSNYTCTKCNPGYFLHD